MMIKVVSVVLDVVTDMSAHAENIAELSVVRLMSPNMSTHAANTAELSMMCLMLYKHDCTCRKHRRMLSACTPVLEELLPDFVAGQGLLSALHCDSHHVCTLIHALLHLHRQTMHRGSPCTVILTMSAP